jgi:hypothetical protein
MYFSYVSCCYNRPESGWLRYDLDLEPAKLIVWCFRVSWFRMGMSSFEGAIWILPGFLNSTFVCVRCTDLEQGRTFSTLGRFARLVVECRKTVLCCSVALVHWFLRPVRGGSPSSPHFGDWRTLEWPRISTCVSWRNSLLHITVWTFLEMSRGNSCHFRCLWIARPFLCMATSFRNEASFRDDKKVWAGDMRTVTPYNLSWGLSYSFLDE